MKLMEEGIEHRPLRAPRENGGRLIDPPADAVAGIVAGNQRSALASDYDVQGRPLAQLAAQARRELVEAAWRYTSTYRDVTRPDEQAQQRVFLAGHQPQLFHPGVWFKNFALSDLAAQHRAVAVNLAIDSDTIKAASLRVPTGTVDLPRAESVSFDQPGAEIPYEERRIVDRACLESFGERASRFDTTAHAENIHAGVHTADHALKGWFHSPGHFKNLFRPHARVGLGRDAGMFTQMFGG